MNDNGKAPSTESAQKHDPREVLDGIKRAKILALLRMGCSRRAAARQVGCAPSTITRTAARDAEFGEQVAEAENRAEVQALKLLLRTAQQEKYWRVAAWILERRNPEEYGRRAPFTFTGDQVLTLLARGLQEVVPAIPADKLDEVLDGFQEFLADVASDANLRRPDEAALAAIEEYRPATADEEPPAVDAAAGEKPMVPAKLAPAAAPPAPRANGRPQPVAEAARVPARRVSCLEQFVTRTPKRELQIAGT